MFIIIVVVSWENSSCPLPDPDFDFLAWQSADGKNNGYNGVNLSLEWLTFFPLAKNNDNMIVDLLIEKKYQF